MLSVTCDAFIHTLDECIQLATGGSTPSLLLLSPMSSNNGEQLTIQRKSSNFSQRSQSTECIDKNPFNLDRDSGFDEQDFRSERLHSSYDDNSSLSSVKSARSSSHQRSISSDLNNPIYRENKAYELRLKALNDQSTRTMPIVHRYRKNTQANIYMRYQ